MANQQKQEKNNLATKEAPSEDRSESGEEEEKPPGWLP